MARTKNRYRMATVEEMPCQAYRTGIYIRLSKERTESWRNKSQSLETQESLARNFAKERGLIVTKCYIDYEYSGKTFNRPAYQDMMEDIKNGVINCIIIRDLSRLGRNYIEMGRLIDKVFPFMGVRFISINDNLDTLNGLGDKKSFEVEIKNLVNDLYSKDISKKVTASHIQKAKQGYFIAGFAPYGYKLERREGGNRLVIDAIVQSVMVDVFEKLMAGQSMNQVTKYLNQQKVATPMTYRQTGERYRTENDTRQWQSANLQRLVQNPAFYGSLIQRRHNKTLTEKDYIQVDNCHEAYIAKEEFQTLQKLIRERRSIRKQTQPRTTNRYKGLIYVKGQSTQMRRYCRHFSNSKSEYDYYYFMDYIHGSAPSEKQTVYISEQALDKIVLSLIQTEMKRLGTVKNLLPKLEMKRDECLRDCQKQIKNLQRTLASLQAEQGELYLNYRLEAQERETYLSQKATIISKIETLSKEIAHYEALAMRIEEKHSQQVSWVKHLAKCQNQSVLTAELLNEVIERIDVEVDKSVTVTFTCLMGGDDHV
ncbi:recombinase family protein [Streptococcus pseudoporcinus]|uniref:Site-specific recombinase n=1 Tax=Streptococcus pseudoporcinus TaxID=361101 RepID=A0A4U9XV01_9STRE|nr:recombinase family protein [Streptococcus pseudoporcinus]VTS16818.1 site-specific recombinase [Streptococcus pseudoporcinus]VUC68084.1 site-specific recombinase [Streptococcus pseudoporcinus]VUC98980.1 site-specific recombinase [Streptococcus pseudoporcinus]VUC99372.1 site-specific recombinase [Streptococcus pseudoporcinus]